MVKNSDMIKDLIKQATGNEPQMREPNCLLWKADHKNCVGCISELSCCQLVTIMLATLKGSIYRPKDFDDFNLTMSKISEIVDRILEAKNVDDVKSIV